MMAGFFRQLWHAKAPSSEKPFRDELLSIERLEERALALAASFTIDPSPRRRARNIFPRFDDNARVLRVWPDGLDPVGLDAAGRGSGLVPLGALGVVVGGGAPGLARLIADRGDDPASPAAALAAFDDVARVVSEVALACFGLGFMPELHGQNAVLACEAGRVSGVVLRDLDTVRLHRPWLAEAGLTDPGYDVKPGAPNSLWAQSPEELLGWFQTLALQVSLRSVGVALTNE